MPNIFRRKPKEKVSNIADTPKESRYVPKQSKKAIVFFVINILSIVLYSSYTLFITYKMSGENIFLKKFITTLLIIYVIAFFLLILFSLGSKTKLKSRLKYYKSSIAFFKYAMQIINFVLSITTAISAFASTGRADAGAILYAIFSLIITIILIFVEVVKIIIHKNIPLIKQNFLEIREPEKFNENSEDDDNTLSK